MSTPSEPRHSLDYGDASGTKTHQPRIEGLTPSQRILLEEAKRKQEFASGARPSGQSGGGGIRETINRHPAWSIGAVALCLTAWLVFEFRPKPTPKAAYTVDDGQTFFTHDYVVPPFDYQGKEAVQAVMFSCDQGSSQFVGYLLRFKPEAKAKLEAEARTSKGKKDRGPMDMSGAEVKKPGQGTWVGHFNPRDMGKQIQDAIQSGQDPSNLHFESYDQITIVKCPDGKPAVPVGAP